jgi:hypothetical protein
MKEALSLSMSMFSSKEALSSTRESLIIDAIRTARTQALAEAAAIARDYDEDHANRAVMLNTAAGIFERIRALKS